jgi:hypothetical protein
MIRRSYLYKRNAIASAHHIDRFERKAAKYKATKDCVRLKVLTVPNVLFPAQELSGCLA